MAKATRPTGLRATTIFLMAALAVPSLATAPARAQPGAASDREAVTSAWAALDAAWNARDAKAFSLLFSEDVSFEFVRRGQSLDGRAAVFERFAERFPTYSPDLRHRTSVRRMLAIAPHLLAVDGQVDILRQSADASGAPAVIKSFAIFALMSRDAAGLSIRALRIYELLEESDNARPA